MDLGSSTVAFVIGLVLVGLYLWRQGKTTPPAEMAVEELQALATGNDWRHWKTGLGELIRRGVDVQPYVARIAEHLLADSLLQREAARVTLTELFPDWQAQLAASGYVSTAAPDDSRAKLAPVFQHFRLLPPG